MNQREATVSTILGVLAERGVDYELNGPTPISEFLTPDDKAQVREALFSMFRDGSVSYKPEFQEKVDDDSELRKYISGLVNNWVRKAKEFNSGQAYVAKNPGSRVSDSQLKELKKLLAQVKDEGNDEAIEQVNEAIEARISEIKPKSQPINVDALPSSLKHLVK